MEKQDTNAKVTFTIDLLKGQGIPFKSGPGSIILAVVTAAVPVVIAVFLYSLYLHNSVTSRMERREVVRLQEKTNQLSDAVNAQKALESEQVLYRACLSEVKASIEKFDQWSPLLATLAQELPATVVLTSLVVEQDSIEKEIPKKDDPKKKIKVNVPVTKLILKVNNQGQGDCREEVKEFRDRLYASSVFASKLQDIAFSRKSEPVNGRETVSYEIECMFKPEQ